MTDVAPALDSGATRVALVVGATGLVGQELVRQLLLDDDYDVVRTFVRRPSAAPHPKLDERVVDFTALASFAEALAGEVLFSTLGTTRRAAGSTALQFQVDHDLNLALAAVAASRGVPAYVLLSSAGAGAHSPFFYPRMKGLLERAVVSLAFQSLRILRPGPLDGERAEPRPSERLALGLLRGLPAWRGLSGLRPVPVAVVARAMRVLAADWSPGVQIVRAAEIFLLGED